MASSVDAKLLRQTKFPPEFNQKVDMKKVNVEVMKKWIASKISGILGNEDDVVIELCFNLLEGSRFVHDLSCYAAIILTSDGKPEIKALQISLTGFLDKDTPRFCKELWNLCLSAQSSPQGVPKELLEAKKLELLQEKIDAEKIAEEMKRCKEQESARDQDVEMIRQKERAERGRGRAAGGSGGGGGGGGGGRGARSFEPRRPRSPSPPSYRRGSPDRGPPLRREADIYIPSNRGGRRPMQRDRSRTRSTTTSASRSPAPPSPAHHHRRRRYRSRSRSPLRQARSRRSSTNSISPPPRRGYRRSRRRSISRGGRSRSESHSDRSLSRSPRRRRRSSTSPSPSISPSPPPRYRPRTRRSPSPKSRSISRDRNGRRDRNSRRSRRSPSFHSPDDRRVSRADVVKDHTTRDDRRLSRSEERQARRRHHSRSRSRSRSRSQNAKRERRRHRSLERWAPAAKKRRNTSSVTSPDDKRRKIADASAEAVRSGRSPSRSHVKEDERMAKDDDKESKQASSYSTVPIPPQSVRQLTANDLREKLLRQKIKASQRRSVDGGEG